MYYHNCVLHLFRPFLKVSFVQSSKAPRTICTEAATVISQLLGNVSQTYGLRRNFLLMTHCLTTAAIIHVVNLTGSNPAPAIAEPAAEYLCDTIYALHTMIPGAPIIERYLSVVPTLFLRWGVTAPYAVMKAMQETEIGPRMHIAAKASAFSSHRALPLGKGKSPQEHDESCSDHTCPAAPHSHLSDRPYSSQPSKPEPTPDLGIPNSAQQHLFWTPFPESVDGLPLLPNSVGYTNLANQNMDITSMLDSGIVGDWAQFNKDGFMIGAQGNDGQTVWAAPPWGCLP